VTCVLLLSDPSTKFNPFPTITVGLAYELLVSHNPLKRVCPSDVTVNSNFLQVSRPITILVGSPSSTKNLCSTHIESNSLSFRTTYSWLSQLFPLITTPKTGGPLLIGHLSNLMHALHIKLKHE
jgi:hypothetical protein